MIEIPERIWAPILGFGAKYIVSNDGHVKNKITGSTMKQWNNSSGYPLVRLSYCQQRECPRVHRLVAFAFCSGQSDQKCVVNHIDNNPENNRFENLEWCTQAENVAHGRRQGRYQDDHWAGKRSPNAHLSDAQVLEIKKLRRSGLSYRDISNKCSVSRRTIGRILHGESYV